MDQTPYRVICPTHGPQFLTDAQYNAGMDNPDAPWRCPTCGQRAEWDDAWYESHMDNEEGDANANPHA